MQSHNQLDHTCRLSLKQSGDCTAGSCDWKTLKLSSSTKMKQTHVESSEACDCSMVQAAWHVKCMWRAVKHVSMVQAERAVSSACGKKWSMVQAAG